MDGIRIGDLEKRFRQANGDAKKFWEAYRQAAEYAAPQINDFNDTPGVTK
jgi:hypothetical protein